jgi:HlyD family secretion protein
LDIQRKVDPRKKRIKQIGFSVLGAIIILGITLGLSRLKPAAPTVERGTVWIDTVKRGEMLRQVRGTGTLVPEVVQWIPAATEGRVQRILILAGTPVKADTVILELSNPELVVSEKDAELQLKAAEAEFASERVKLQNQQMDQEAAAAGVKSDYLAAQMRYEADESLSKDGLIPDITVKTSKAKAEELATRYEIEKKRVEVNRESIDTQLLVPKAKIDQLRALFDLKRNQVEALKVRAGVDGVVQQVAVEVGQRVVPGATLAKVAQPEHLKAELKISETQAKDIQTGQSASIDTRNGIIPGVVSRIDPAAVNGTVTVDVKLQGTLPKGARPDLTVDGTIELERLEQVLYVGRPASAQDESTVELFRLERDGKNAVHVQVKFGRSSVNNIEVRQGLKEGEQVIVSDTSAWDSFDRIRLE